MKQKTYKEIGIYVHIPFCKKKCDYCDFCSYVGKEEKMEEYFLCLMQEIKEVGEGNRLDYQSGFDPLFFVKTIYIGGGTPSLPDSKFICNIMQIIYENFEVDEHAEITIEVNPRNRDIRKTAKLQKCRH